MGEDDLTRRQILAGITGASGVGVAVGTGTAALTSDSFDFSGSTMQAGVLDLDVSWATNGDQGTSTGSPAVPVTLSKSDSTQRVRLGVSAPDHRGTNNPLVPWMRARCPPDESLARSVEVSIRYADCRVDCALFEGSLRELVEGVALDPDADGSVTPGEQRCLRAGESIELVMDVSLDWFERSDRTTFVLDFVGVQCRGTDRSEAPFSVPEECTESPDEPPAISFIAFCSDTEGAFEGDTTTRIDATDWKSADEPLGVEWQTESVVDFVVVKAGRVFTVYDFRDDAVDSQYAAPFDVDAETSLTDAHQRWASRPCELAADAVGATDYEPKAARKIEYDHGWEASE
jgi:hypothetical protein